MDGATKIWVGFIAYGETTLKYLPSFLESLEAQTGVELKVVAVDNTEGDSSNLKYLKSRPEVEVIASGKNLGFGKAYNLMISRAVAAGADYFFVTNPDVIFEPGALKELAAALAADERLASACPKLRRWDFAAGKKTEFIDSCGLQLLPGLRFIDAGQGETDRGQCDEVKIIGSSGAAALFRISALKEVSDEHGYFDERMFMYKEDCDLAYRLFLKGYGAKCVPAAIGYHDRTAAAEGKGWLAQISARTAKSRQVRLWSFSNQQLVYKKHWASQNLQGKLAIIYQEAKAATFALLFERFLLKGLSVLFRK